MKFGSLTAVQSASLNKNINTFVLYTNKVSLYIYIHMYIYFKENNGQKVSLLFGHGLNVC